VTKLTDIGEDALIRRITALAPLDPHAAGGIHDDCAVVDPGPGSPTLLLLKTDALVAGVHFLDDAPPRAVGWKAIARVVSDFAAMGGRADRFLITLALPSASAVEWVEDLYRGMSDCLRAFGAVLAGGETSQVPPGSAAVISVAATGHVRREDLVLRGTASAGDTLMVTGTLGGSLAGKHLAFTPRLREAEWLVRHFKPTAMMDLSDGLAKDLPRLATASACGFRLDPAALPVSPGCSPANALNDGEDFELLFAVESDQVAALCAAWETTFPEIPLTPIGKLVPPDEGEVLEGGWDHFSAPSLAMP
jgi:thiamine-monophosphate kinase